MIAFSNNKQNLNAIASCPLCSSKGIELSCISSAFMIDALGSYYSETLPADISILDYRIIRCERCSLEYASPMMPGSDKFYEWITSHGDYYPLKRWEWSVATDMIVRAASLSPINVLEVGCGSGEFLHSLQKTKNINVVGLDLTASSVALCRKKNIEAYCETIETFIANKEYGSSRFDYVVAFHTLEHVDNPKYLISSMVSLLQDSGRVLVSTPYSPMSFETSWFDPLNHPPHHMTRWNVQSYNELASQLGLMIEFHMPSASNAARRTLYALSLHWNGRQPVSKWHLIKKMIAHPWVTKQEIAMQFRREKFQGKVLPDVVLAEFHK